MKRGECAFIKATVLDTEILYERRSSLFFLGDPSDEELSGICSLPSFEAYKEQKPTLYSFCIDVTDDCNLRCDYCFNEAKQHRTISYNLAVSFLEKAFKAFPDGERYIVDLSGKGEPLLALKRVLEIAEWCHKKQDEIRREVLVQFVTNGTLLSPSIAALLQKRGILFGVSLDGNRLIHDAHRRDKAGKPTFETALRNVSAIENRSFVGCAATLTKDVFPLLESVLFLSRYFPTLSYRPARRASAFDYASALEWEKQYDRLAKRLLDDGFMNDDALFMCLMNGDDFFGRYLCRVFGGERVGARCDAGITRFAIDGDGLIYPCPASSTDRSFSFGTEPDLRSISKKSLEHGISTCAECPFKPLCGGECEIVLREEGRQDEALCHFRKHLICLAGYLERQLFAVNPMFALRLQKFAIQKSMRNRANKDLSEFLAKHPEMTFSEVKRYLDSLGSNKEKGENP